MLDVLRGFAMFGVLLSNLNDWYGTKTAATPIDRVFAWAQEWLWESRFYSLLAFLFGIGFALQLIRAEERGLDIRAAYYRRMAALLVIGVLHGTLIWSGDILTAYALVGCMLWLFRGLSIRALVIAAVFVETVFRYIAIMLLRSFHLRTVPREPGSIADFIYAHGSFLQIHSERVHVYFDQLGRFPFGLYPGFLALMIIGLAVAKSGILRNLPERLGAIRKALWISLGCMVIGAYLSEHIGSWWKPLTHYPESVHDPTFWSPRSSLIGLPYHLATWGMAATFACLLAIHSVVHPDSRLNQWLRAVGRMPLTTYLTQSVISTLLLYNYGLGLYGRLGYAAVFALSVAIFAGQVVASRWWLRRFEFGPAEWLWRVLTYGRRIPLRQHA